MAPSVLVSGQSIHLEASRQQLQVQKIKGKGKEHTQKPSLPMYTIILQGSYVAELTSTEPGVVVSNPKPAP